MRANLAMVDAFLRRSIIETSNYKDEDLGFLGVAPGEEQLNIHNRSVTLIVVALLYHCLENYFDLVRVSPGLEDRGLQDFFNTLGSRRQFVDGMKTVRKGVFHVRSPRSWRGRGVNFLDKTCARRGGLLAVMSELRGLLYDFTEKVFMGELKIMPNDVYEHSEKIRNAMSGLKEKFESGEIEFSEYLEAMRSSEEDAPESG